MADAIKYAEGVMALQIKDRKFMPLVQTGSESAGTVPVGQIFDPMEGFGRREELSPVRVPVTISPARANNTCWPRTSKGTARGGARGATPINVVLVADVEMVGDNFFRWREQGGLPGQDIDFDFDNVTFVLNALDSLAGDDRFLETPQAPAPAPHAGAIRRQDPRGPRGKRPGRARSSARSTTTTSRRRSRRSRPSRRRSCWKPRSGELGTVEHRPVARQ